MDPAVGGWVSSLEERARAVLAEPVHRYFRQGAREGVSAGEASAAWEQFRLLPRVLHDVTRVTTETSALGTPLRTPFAVAPSTLQRAAHPDGELAVARAAVEAGSLMVVSSNAGSDFGSIGATGVAWWLQAYLPADRPTARPLLDRAVDAGARAVVLTADTPVVGTKYEPGESVWDAIDPGWLRVNFPEGYGARAGDEKATDLGPHDIGWLREVTGLPVVVKGVLRGDDARRCLDAGAAAVWVSNHGGRQLDGAAATAHCLPAVSRAVGDGAEVYVDGGVRCGRHGLVAAAAGARVAFLGRPVLWALATEGQAGVRRLLGQLTEELEECLRLAGLAAVGQAHDDLLAPRGCGPAKGEDDHTELI
ncbi:MAG TPA: alpha-hydroxy acid oxidase [Nocardioidaceae bacterium]|jgi:4-hydroxymandelate oxidase|nr:alpha-hydroxy acid oxidase [Nocardioidaceae bacterium]